MSMGKLYVWCLAEKLPYEPLLAFQNALQQARYLQRLPDLLFCLEHLPTITLGKNSRFEHLLVSQEHLKEQGIALFQSNRGGDITYHGPGQWICYPIIALKDKERDLKRYVFTLERLILQLLSRFDVKAERHEGFRGIWLGNKKIAAIGVRIVQWVSMHGFALNVQLGCLAGFKHMLPCGLEGRDVTCLEEVLGRSVKMSEVLACLPAIAASVFEKELWVVPEVVCQKLSLLLKEGLVSQALEMLENYPMIPIA